MMDFDAMVVVLDVLLVFASAPSIAPAAAMNISCSKLNLSVNIRLAHHFL
jgi:hypothetical protein